MKAVAFAIALAACSDEAGPHALFDFTRAHSLFDAPFPADDLYDGQSGDVSRFPNPAGSVSVEQARALVVGNHGFALTGGVFFPFSEPLDETLLPTITETVASDSAVFIAAIDR